MQAMLLEHNSTLGRWFQHRMFSGGYNWDTLVSKRGGYRQLAHDALELDRFAVSAKH
jgi:hypothetical protein